MNIQDVIAHGAIPDIPIIFCRNGDVAMMLQIWVNDYLANRPTITVLEQWPEEYSHIHALVVTPLSIIGAEPTDSDFTIDIIPELTPDAQACLNAMVRLSIAGIRTSCREIAAAAYGNTSLSSVRIVDFAIRELEMRGLVSKPGDRRPAKLNFGRWKYDAITAQSAGIKITKRK